MHSPGSDHEERPPNRFPERCEMCEGESKDAAKFCRECFTYFCADCLSVIHPSKGAFQGHKLLPGWMGLGPFEPLTYFAGRHLQWYRGDKEKPTAGTTRSDKDGTTGIDNSENRASETDGKKCSEEVSESSKKDNSVKTCTDHNQTCHTPLCTRCAAEHDSHEKLPIDSAHYNAKVSLEEKIKPFLAPMSGLMDVHTNVALLEADLEKIMAIKTSEVLTTYDEHLKTLKDWKASELNKITEKGAKIATETRVMLDVIKERAENIGAVATETSNLIHDDQLHVLKKSTDLCERIDKVINEADMELKDLRPKLADLESSLLFEIDEGFTKMNEIWKNGDETESEDSDADSISKSNDYSRRMKYDRDYA